VTSSEWPSRSSGHLAARTGLRIAVLVTSGGGQDLRRATALTTATKHDVAIIAFDRTKGRLAAARAAMTKLTAHSPDLLLVEGGGFVGIGLALLHRFFYHSQYILSVGDAVGPFLRLQHGRVLGWLGGSFERSAIRRATAYIGWSPYLVGRAIQLGAKTGLTLPGCVSLTDFRPNRDRATLRRQALGIPADQLLLGVVGTIHWSQRQQYAYGLELINALAGTTRGHGIVVGGGSGIDYLKRQAQSLGIAQRVTFTGHLDGPELLQTIQMLDIGLVTQTPECLGLTRLTGKLAEYLACGIPVAMTASPGFFDLVGTAGWPLPLHHPTSAAVARRLTRLIDGVTPDELEAKRHAARLAAETSFNPSENAKRLEALLDNLIEIAPNR